MKSDWAYETGTLAKGSGIGGTLDYTTCYKRGNVVNVAGRIHSLSGQNAWGDFFKIPEGFRPYAKTTCYGFMAITNVGTQPVVCTIDTDGTVTLGYSASNYTTQVMFAASYHV